MANVLKIWDQSQQAYIPISGGGVSGGSDLYVGEQEPEHKYPIWINPDGNVYNGGGKEWTLLNSVILNEAVSFVKLDIDDTDINEIVVDVVWDCALGTGNAGGVTTFRIGANSTAWYNNSINMIFSGANYQFSNSWDERGTVKISRFGENWMFSNAYYGVRTPTTMGFSNPHGLGYHQNHKCVDVPKISSIGFDSNGSDNVLLPVGLVIKIYGR